MEKLSHKYNTSKDYEKLFKLMQNQRVVCFVNYKDYGVDDDGYVLQDVCQTQAIKRGSMHEISARGYSYITAFNKEDFIKQCKKACLEYIDADMQKKGRNDI